jgi:hypothetical protein
MVEDCVGTTSPDYCMLATLYNVKLLFGFVAQSSAIARGLHDVHDVHEAKLGG